MVLRMRSRLHIQRWSGKARQSGPQQSKSLLLVRVARNFGVKCRQTVFLEWRSGRREEGVKMCRAPSMDFASVLRKERVPIGR